MAHNKKMSECDAFTGCDPIGERGGVEPGSRRRTKTSLVHTDAFMRQFTHIIVDRSAGRLAGEPVKPPDSFDGRVIWKNFLHPIRDQGNCGACWAFAVADCLSMRLAIATNGHYKPRLSPAQAVFCNLGSEREAEIALERARNGVPYDYTPAKLRASEREQQKEEVSAVGCQGETLLAAWQYAYRFGLTIENCVPYTGGYVSGSDLRSFGGGGEDLPACSDVLGDSYDMCPTTGKPAERHRANAYYYVPGAPMKYVFPDMSGTTNDQLFDPSGIQDESTLAEVYAGSRDLVAVGPDSQAGTEYDIRQEIYHWGPVTSGFTVHDDFQQWDGQGVYSWDKTSEETGGHAIVILGWGTSDEGVDYWLVRNSWGPNWGDAGYFKIKRGTNECGIEENVIVGFPMLYGFRLYCERPLLSVDEDLLMRSIWGILPSGHKITTAERMIDGRMAPHSTDIDKLQYDSDFWPNLATYLAGKPWQTEYLLQRNRLISLMRPRNQKERMALQHVGIGLAMGTILALGIGYFLFIHNNKTKK